MVELADQLHRAFEGMDVTISVIADVHHHPLNQFSRDQEQSGFPHSTSVSLGQ